MGCEQLISELLAAGYRVRVRVSGGSMSPAIRPGDTVLIEPASAAQVGAGDVVLCRPQRGGLRIHRVLRACLMGPGLWRLITGGDNLGGCDLPIDGASVLGRVAGVEATRLRWLPARWRW